MCGITAFLSKGVKAWPILIEGLKMLQNRGYDSVGGCTLDDESFRIQKYTSTPTFQALSFLEDQDVRGSTGIGHTRWATHGAPLDRNAHPHIDSTGKFAIVHNGIVENHKEWRDFLKEKGYSFKSQTDSEVIVNLWSYKVSKGLSVQEGFREMVGELEGTWGIVGIHRETSHTLFCARHGSPLLIGISQSEGYAMISSEAAGFANYIKEYICLKEKDVVTIDYTGEKIKLEAWSSYTKLKVEGDWETTPDPYPHWTLKEIMSQPDVVRAALGNAGRLEGKRVRLGGLNSHRDLLLSSTDLVILGCGTSLYAGMTRLELFKRISGFRTVQAFDGAEFSLSDISRDPTSKTLLLFVSQSGETKDLSRCLDIGKKEGLTMIGVVNVVDSLISRENHCGVYLGAGREVGVASTKAYTSQVIVLTLIAMWFAQERGLAEGVCEKIIEDLRSLPYDVEKCLSNAETIKDYLELFDGASSAFVLGKGPCYPVALEGALKMKEITYLHTEGFSGSALKHGPFALLTTKTPCIMLCPSLHHLAKMKNACEEMSARHAPVIVISDEKDANVRIPLNQSFSDLLSIIPIQLLAYHLSVKRNINPDMPRNLAKVVTVE